MSTILLITALFSLFNLNSCADVTPTLSTTTLEIFNATASNKFDYDDITCTKPKCTVTCDIQSGCYRTIIDASASETLTLICSNADSCSYLLISQSPSISTEIECTSFTSCNHADFYVSNSSSISLLCNYPSSTSTTSPCAYAKIDAASSTINNNLTINCESRYSCLQLDIYCPLGSGNCNIGCGDTSDSQSCSYMSVYIPNESSNIDINCGTSSTQSACYNTDVLCGSSSSSPGSTLLYDSTNYEWGCNIYQGEGCCPFYDGGYDCNDLGQTTDCGIRCAAGDCINYIIDGSSVSSSLTVYCDSNIGCKGATIKCPDSSVYPFATCTVICGDEYGDVSSSCEDITIKATDSRSLALNCTGSQACKTAQVYCPYDRVGACDITCRSGDYQVCYDMDIYVADDYTYNYLEINCGSSTSNSECTNTYFQCDLDADDTTTDDKSASLLQYQSTNYKWDCQYTTSKYCCPWPNTEPVLCTDYSCSIDCTVDDCSAVDVNASTASSLALYCGTYECEFSTIYCASDTCTIDCDAYYGCKDAVIHANNTDTLTINCDTDSACYNLVIYAVNVNSLTFDSQYYESYYITIYADNAGSVVLNCKNDKACGNLQFYGDYADTIYMETYYDKGFSNGVFRASKAGYISIICASESGEYGCYNNQWYLPSNGENTYIYCYGTGCEYFGSIYVNSSVSLLSLDVNGCGECSSLSSCIGTLDIYCNVSFTYSRSFYGDSCSTTYYYLGPDDVCGCNYFVDNGIANFTNDASDYGCVSSYVYSDDDNSTDVAAILGSVFGVMFCICIIVVFIVACGNASKRRRYSKYWGGTNYIAPTPGIQPAQMQPTAQPVVNVNQPVIQQQPVVMMTGQPVMYVAAGQQQQPVMYIQAQPQQIQAQVSDPTQSPPQQQPFSTNTPMQPAEAVPYNPIIPSAPVGGDPSAPPSYEVASAPPPAYAAADEIPGQAEGGVTNY